MSTKLAMEPSAIARDGDRLFTRKEAADYLRVSVRWLEGCAEIPRVNLGRPGAKRATIRYRRTDLDTHIARCVVDPVRRAR